MNRSATGLSSYCNVCKWPGTAESVAIAAVEAL